mmetsp:Transcript_122584/g.381617  ORF Transcript_122584/g.381617 Transcript_122584/m.381617 type:complete len:299 (+) Transcript_122584:388-1284(+)
MGSGLRAAPGGRSRGRRRALLLLRALRLQVLTLRALRDPLPGLVHVRRDGGVHLPRRIGDEPSGAEGRLPRRGGEDAARLGRPAAGELGGQARDVVGFGCLGGLGGGRVPVGLGGLRGGDGKRARRLHKGGDRPRSRQRHRKVEDRAGVVPGHAEPLLAGGMEDLLLAGCADHLLAGDPRRRQRRLREERRACRGRVAVVGLRGVGQLPLAEDLLARHPRRQQWRLPDEHGAGRRRGEAIVDLGEVRQLPLEVPHRREERGLVGHGRRRGGELPERLRRRRCVRHLLPKELRRGQRHG